MQFFIGLLGLLFIVTSCEKLKESKIIPSKAKKIKKELTIHNDTRIDNYYWLRDREDPKVIKYLENENEYSDAVMKDTKKLQTKLYDEIVNRIKQEDESVPYKFNGYYYYTRFEKGNEHPIYCRKKGSLESKEEILLNENEMAKGFSYFHIADFSVSPDNKIIAYSVDTLSRRKYTIKFINLETSKLLKDNIPNTSGNIVWANDNKTIFYNVKDESLRPYKTVKHILRTDVKNDKTVYEEKIIGHLSRDSTAINGREKSERTSYNNKKSKYKKGRPKKGERRPVKEASRIEKQKDMNLEEMIIDLPKICDAGTKKNSKGKTETCCLSNVSRCSLLSKGL